MSKKLGLGLLAAVFCGSAYFQKAEAVDYTKSSAGVLQSKIQERMKKGGNEKDLIELVAAYEIVAPKKHDVSIIERVVGAVDKKYPKLREKIDEKKSELQGKKKEEKLEEKKEQEKKEEKKEQEKKEEKKEQEKKEEKGGEVTLESVIKKAKGGDATALIAFIKNKVENNAPQKELDAIKYAVDQEKLKDAIGDLNYSVLLPE